MKVPQTPGGSFGLPPEAQEAISKHEAKKYAPAEDNAEEAASEDDESLTGSEYDKAVKMAPAKAKAALKKDLDIVITDDDIFTLITAGQLTKRASIVKTSNFTLTAELKTLTAEEVSVIDQLLTEEAKKTPMSQGGYESRFAMWTLALGVVKINGKMIPSEGIPLVNGKTLGKQDDNADIDFLALAKAREKVLKGFSAIVVDKLSRAHSRFALACNMIVGDPDSPLLERPSQTQEESQEKI